MVIFPLAPNQTIAQVCSNGARGILLSNVSDAQINRGWVTLGPNLGCSSWSRPMMFGSAESEHPRLINGEIISDVFQPM